MKRRTVEQYEDDEIQGVPVTPVLRRPADDTAQRMVREIAALRRQLDELRALSAESEATDSARNVTLVAANDPAGTYDGQLRWATNGRKPGEGAGVGTGILVYWNVAAAVWWTVHGNAVITI